MCQIILPSDTSENKAKCMRHSMQVQEVPLKTTKFADTGNESHLDGQHQGMGSVGQQSIVEPEQTW